MTYYLPTSTNAIIEAINSSTPEQRQRLCVEWPALAHALAAMLVANHLSSPREWQEVSCSD